jgi:2-C-methyl-D-erythritol 4-phosphate cytidylyltransferase/2-C-methyl-D-erythritol 2,4-cyclodiphosphate synthase
MKVYTVMLAGGSGTRMKTPINKTLIPLCGKTVIRRSVEAFSGFTDEMVVVCYPDSMSDMIREITKLTLSFPVRFVTGGDTRQQSVQKGLLAFQFEADDIVLIHDAARCLVSSEVIENVITGVKSAGSVVPGIPVSSTYKFCDDQQFITETPDRTHLFEIQTPQGFSASDLLTVSLKASKDGFLGTDDASLMEHYGFPVQIVPGSRNNLKLTTQDDLIAANIILKGNNKPMRVGMGYDVHRLVEGRKLILCGIEIPWPLGLLGHSDADVALHALMDAMLGACGMGDIGQHFPDTDDRFKGVSSLLLLKETNRLINAAGFTVYNADITIVAQKPKLLPYIPQMKHVVAGCLDIEESFVNVKATTTEKLGFEGREEGISSYAVCLVEQKH